MTLFNSHHNPKKLANVVIPLWRLSYEEQLKVKFEAQNKILRRLESCLQMINRLKVTIAAPKSEMETSFVYDLTI